MLNFVTCHDWAFMASNPKEEEVLEAALAGVSQVAERGGPVLRDSMAAWLRWILGSITPPIFPRLPA